MRAIKALAGLAMASALFAGCGGTADPDWNAKDMAKRDGAPDLANDYLTELQALQKECKDNDPSSIEASIDIAVSKLSATKKPSTRLLMLQKLNRAAAKQGGKADCQSLVIAMVSKVTGDTYKVK